MSTRRRIKAAAILPPKRPTRDVSVKSSKEPERTKLEQKPFLGREVENLSTPNVAESPTKVKVSAERAFADDKLASVKSIENTADNYLKNAKQETGSNILPEQVDGNDNEVFKSPPIVTNPNRVDGFCVSDVSSYRNDDPRVNKISSQGPPSPVKFRQRIRPMPFFGMRRNSTQGNGSDVEEEPKRQRHTSTSSNTGSTTPQRMRPLAVQRTRTESSCSNISDYIRDNNNKSMRKATSEEHSRLYAARKDFLARFNGRIPEKSAMKMSDLIYYNPITNPMVATELQPPKSVNDETNIKLPPEKIEKSKEENICMPVPQLKLGPDGEMIVDEQSLVIETTAEKEARQTLANTKVIYMDEFSGNNGFYRRSKRTRDWPSEETIKFYRCLHTVGTDFSLMLTLFPNRTRRELKLKFKKEERTNLNLINKALLFPKAFNVAELKQELDKEQQEYDAIKKELKDINKKKAEKIKGKPRRKPAYSSKTANILTDGDLIYEHKEKTEATPNSAKPKKMKTDNERKVNKRKTGCQKKIRTKQDGNETDKITLDDNNLLIRNSKDECANSDICKNNPEHEFETIIATISEPLCLDSFDQDNPCESNVNSASKSTIENYTYTVTTNSIEIAPEVLYAPTTQLISGIMPSPITIVDSIAPETTPNTNKKCDESKSSVGTKKFCSDLGTRLSVTNAENIQLPKAEPFQPSQKRYNIVDCNVFPLVESNPTEPVPLANGEVEGNQQFSVVDKEIAYSETGCLELKPQPICTPKIENRIELTVENSKINMYNEATSEHTYIAGENDDYCLKKDVVYDYRREAPGAFSTDEENGDIVEYNGHSKQNNELEHVQLMKNPSTSELGTEIVANQKATKGEICVNSDAINEVKDIDAEMERFMLNDLGTILTNLVNGSLVVVASEDENDSAKMINEIYVMNRETGTLSDSPLDLPEDIVNCIVEELSMT